MILFKPKAHKRYLTMVLKNNMPGNSLDSIRVTLAYFAISGLEILNGIEDLGDYANIIIEWIYKFQSSKENNAGFLNSLAFCNLPKYKSGHIAATYSALTSLLILGDDLSRLDKKSIIESLRLLQLEDGSFEGAKNAAENDMRFIFCAASICYILDDWSGMNVEKAVQYILKSVTYEGGIGQGPDLESHGGSTYCALATLTLTNQLHRLTQDQVNNLIRWIVNLQENGFQGRTNKVEDCCYTFWVGAALKLLNSYNLINQERLQNFVLSTQDFQLGGLSKWPSYRSDPLHTYFGLAGLTLMKYEGLNEVMPMLNISYKAHAHLQRLHKSWRAV